MCPKVNFFESVWLCLLSHSFVKSDSKAILMHRNAITGTLIGLWTPFQPLQSSNFRHTWRQTAPRQRVRIVVQSSGSSDGKQDAHTQKCPTLNPYIFIQPQNIEKVVESQTFLTTGTQSVAWLTATLAYTRHRWDSGGSSSSTGHRWTT